MQSRDPQLRGNFARRLKALREALALQRGLKPNAFSQVDMAKLLGIGDERYRRYERGEAEASFDVLVQLRRLTGVSLDVLVAGEPPGNAAMIPPEGRSIETVHLSDRLRWVREAVTRDIAEAAAAMDTDLSTWRRYEDGSAEPSVQMLMKVAHRWGAGLDFLYRGQLSGISRRVLQSILARHPELASQAADRASRYQATPRNRRAKGDDKHDPEAKVIPLLRGEQ